LVGAVGETSTRRRIGWIFRIDGRDAELAEREFNGIGEPEASTRLVWKIASSRASIVQPA
jgi:hypothetical protein